MSAAAHAAGLPAIVSRNEKGGRVELSWPELRRQVASLALHLQAQGVQPGDRVAAYLPNIPETMVAFLATVSIGGVWSVCAPDMGTTAVLDRFRQIEPKVLIACDGVHLRRTRLRPPRGGGRAARGAAHGDARDRAHQPGRGGADATGGAGRRRAVRSFAAVTARDDADTAAFEPQWLPFDHPLWIVYSSGTTGLPKPIVHGHGGTVIVALALKVLHNDVGCSYDANSWGERFHWYSSTGWVMWNAQTSGLLNGTTCVIYDGNPGGSKDKPDWTMLWRFAAEQGVTFFGAGAAFFANCMKAGVDLSSLRRPVEGARAGHHRLAAVAGGAEPGAPRADSRPHRAGPRAPSATSGGATSPAAPTSRRLRRRPPRAAAGARAGCSAGCSAARSRPGTSRASR